MIEFPFVLAAGLLGSSHCIGMCGGFALALGSSSRTVVANLRRQGVYSVGRIFTYATLGALTGFGGMRLSQVMPKLINVPALLAIVAGVFLVYQGLATLGVWKWRARSSSSASPCLAGTFFASFLTAPGLTNAFLAGLLTGLLPCGLLYGMLALAASTGNMFWGAALMTLFGVGTVPLMVLTGCSGSLLSLAARRYLFQAAAWCVVVTGLVTIGRGFGFLSFFSEAAGGCPMCG